MNILVQSIFFWMWTLAQHTVLACIPLHFMVTRLWITTCTDVDMGRRSDKWVKVHYFYVWHFFARWYSVTVQLNWSGSFAHSSIKTLLLMHSESWCWLGLMPCWEGATRNELLKKSLNSFSNLSQSNWLHLVQIMLIMWQTFPQGWNWITLQYWFQPNW